MSAPWTGGCACGALRYEIPASQPLLMNHCQCRDCQRASGAGHGAYLSFPGRAQVRVQGEAAHWDLPGDSGNVRTRSFCPRCGAPVYITFAANADVFTVTAASLDDPTRYAPQLVTYAVRGLPWDYLDPTLPKVERMPG